METSRITFTVSSKMAQKQSQVSAFAFFAIFCGQFHSCIQGEYSVAIRSGGDCFKVVLASHAG